MRAIVLLPGVLVLIIAGCCIAGCSFLPFSETGSSDANRHAAPAGFSTGIPPEDTTEFQSGMDTGLLYGLIFPGDPVPDEMAVVNTSGLNGTAGMMPADIHIHYIKGEALTESGLASRWTFGIRHLNKTFVVTEDQYGVSVLELNASLPEEEILPDQIVMPADLLIKNHAAIFGDTGGKGTYDLSLGDGKYSLKIFQGTTQKVLTFDARTGALL